MTSKRSRSQSGKMAKRKGSTFERKLTKLFSEWSGIDLKRTPQSGGFAKAGTMFRGDVGPINPEDFDKWPFTVECFGRDTLVLTAQGYRKICELKVNDKVLTHKGRFRNITNIMTRDAIILSLKSPFVSDSIKVTANHPFEDFSGNWVRAEDITHTSHIWRGFNTVRTRKLKWLNCINQPDKKSLGQINTDYKHCKCGCGTVIKSKDSRGRDIHYKLGHAGKTYYKGIPKKVVLDSELCYILGLYIAEGHSTNDRVVWTFGKDEITYANRVRECILSSFNIDCTISTVANTIRVVANSTYLSKTIKKYFSTGSRNKLLGRFIYLDKPRLIAMLSGCFDGDGALGMDYVKYTTMSKSLVYEIQVALFSLGIVSMVSRNRKRNIYNINISRYSIEKFYSILYNTKVERVTNSSMDDGVNMIDKHASRLYNKKVKYTINEGYTEVYNITVEEDETYIVEGGIVVHNCKNQESWTFDNVLTAKSPLYDFWEQCAEEAELTGKFPLLVFTKNYNSMYVAVDYDTLTYWNSKLSINKDENLNQLIIIKDQYTLVIWLLEDFLNTFSVEDFYEHDRS